jgi:hypothetical protein
LISPTFGAFAHILIELAKVSWDVEGGIAEWLANGFQQPTPESDPEPNFKSPSLVMKLSQ